MNSTNRVLQFSALLYEPAVHWLRLRAFNGMSDVRADDVELVVMPTISVVLIQAAAVALGNPTDISVYVSVTSKPCLVDIIQCR